MVGLLGLMFGTGGSSAKESSDEEKYAVVEAERERVTDVQSRNEATHIVDRDTGELAEIEHNQPLMSKMFGGSFIKRSPEEEKAIRKAKQRDELKKERKRQAEAEEDAKAKKAYNEAVVKEKASRKARRYVRQTERRSRARPFTVQDYSGVYIPAFGMRKASSSTSVSYASHGVYPYNMVSMPIANMADSFVVTQAHHGAGRLTNPLFEFSGSSGKHSNGSKGRIGRLSNPLFDSFY